MKNERKIKSMIAKCLVLTICISSVHWNVWAESINSQMLKNQAIATSSNADKLIGEEEEVKEVESVKEAESV